MAVLALAAVGSAIGGAAITGTVLGMSGAAFGWMAGSMAGSLLFPPKAPDGPRLEDKSVQVSTYGQPIPRVYGTYRLAGNMIWSTELLETAREEGGKGGPSYTTYSYRASFAVSICRGPIEGIRRIWADGKLIFDQSETNTGPQRDFNAQALAVYTGTESQLPDPTIQALQGDTPAYRGQAYVVFTDLQLERFGNRIPSLTFEVVRLGSSAPRGSRLIVPTPAAATVASNCVVDTDTGYVWASYGQTLVCFDPVQETVVQSIPLGGDTSTRRLVFCQPTRTVWVCDTDVFDNTLVVVSADSYVPIYTRNMASRTLCAFCPENGEMVFGSTYLSAEGTSWVNVSSYALTNVSDGLGFRWDGVWVPEFNQMVLTGQARLSSHLVSVFSRTLLLNPALSGANQSAHYVNALAYDTTRQLVYRAYLGDLRVALYDPATQAITTRTITGVTGVEIRAIFYHEPIDRIIASMATSSQLYVINPDTFAVERTIINGGGQILSMVPAVGLPDRIYGVNESGLSVIFLGDVLYTATEPLPDVIAQESALVGLEAGDLNTTALAGLQVAGFSPSGGAVRSAIEVLMMAYRFDAVESGGQIKFVRRGGTVAATLDDLDLAAHQPGNDVPAPLPMVRAEEVELPQRVTVRYANPAADYQTSAQSAQRLTGRAAALQAVDLPLVLSDDEARSLAEAALYSAWTARTSATITTTLKHSALEPTDIVAVAGNTLRITRRTENAGLLTFEASFENGSVYTQSATGAASDVPEQNIPLRGTTGLEFLDIPALRDQDDDAGFYLAASGYAGGWPGALVYKSADGGTTFSEWQLAGTAATIGAAVNALAAYAENTFDESNSVTVVLRGGTLSSLSELAVLNGGNAALLGSEIIQFRSATLNANGSYTLTGLLRGRKGTPTGGHVAGDRFVLLTTSSLLRPPAVDSEVGLARHYRPVTIGATLAGARTLPFTNTAQAQRPFPMVHLGGGRSSGGDVLITWERRSRVGGAWRDYTDAPLTEASASYEVDVFTDATYTTVARTLASTVRSVTYTSAQQLTDFGSTQAVVYLRAYQISATVGRGGALQGTV